MPRVTVSLDGAPLTEVELSKDRTTIGRRPYNDVVLNDLTVSGEHAVLLLADGKTWIEDLQSTNGTRLNGQPLTQRQALQTADTIAIGQYALRYDAATATVTATANPPPPPAPSDTVCKIKILSGSAMGREMALSKPVTTIGKPGIVVAAITRQTHGYTVHKIEGSSAPTLNGQSIGSQTVTLKNGDVIALAGTQMQFMQS